LVLTHGRDLQRPNYKKIITRISPWGKERLKKWVEKKVRTGKARGNNDGNNGGKRKMAYGVSIVSHFGGYLDKI
jgi:hypothetical protein